MSTKQRVEKNLSPVQKMFADAINYDALNKALSNPKSRKELEKIFSKVRY